MSDIVDDGELEDCRLYIEGLEVRLAACEALVERWRGESAQADAIAHYANASSLRVCADELEAAIRGETNDEQAG